jgi:hypothetical protein
MGQWHLSEGDCIAALPEAAKVALPEMKYYLKTTSPGQTTANGYQLNNNLVFFK